MNYTYYLNPIHWINFLLTYSCAQQLRHNFQDTLSQRIGLKVQIDSVDFKINRLTLNKLTVDQPSGFKSDRPFVQIKQVNIDYCPWNLIFGDHPIFGRVSIIGPKVRVIVGFKDNNLRLWEKNLPKLPPPEKLCEVNTLEIENIKISVQNSWMTIPSRINNLKVKNISNKTFQTPKNILNFIKDNLPHLFGLL